MSPYSTTDMDYFWSDQYTLEPWANVERALLLAQAEKHVIPIEWAEEAALTPAPDIDKWEYHKSRTRHEFVAFLDAWGLEHVHIGVTSSDIIDPAHALRYRAINDHLATDAYRLREALLTYALTNMDKPRLGRTHGQPAVPTTFGNRYADLTHQTDRAARRLTQARRDLETGMLSGPTGGYPHTRPATATPAPEPPRPRRYLIRSR